MKRYLLVCWAVSLVFCGGAFAGELKMPSEKMLLAVGKMHFELQRSGLKVSKANLCVDATNNVHLTVETSQGTAAGYWWFLKYYKFDASNPSAPTEIVVLDQMFVHDEPWLKSPSIAIDPNGNCHIAYSKREVTINPGDVYYAEQVGGVWQAPINLSQSETPSSEASIDVYGGKVCATWVEDETAGKQVWRRKKDVGGLWIEAPVRCSDIVTAGSIGAYNPFCASGIAGWVENIDNTNYAVKYLRTDPVATVQTLYSAAHYQTYPHGVLGSDGLTLNSIWTETTLGTPTTGPWISEVKYANNAGKKVAYLEVLAGTETPSVYTDYRDGYISYPSGVSVDYANDELTYTLPYLVPGNDYTVQIVGYHESTGFWNEQVKLDGKEAKVLKVKAHVPETLLVNIPAGYYADDRKITLSIRRLTGEYAVIANINVYQTEKVTGGKLGGAQMAEGTEARGQEIAFKLQPSYPNPARNLANISFALPKAGYVSLKVYNIQGQLVKTVVNEEKPAGIHSIAWDCKNSEGNQAANGIYLYQLIAGGNTATRKLVLVK